MAAVDNEPLTHESLLRDVRGARGAAAGALPAVVGPALAALPSVRARADGPSARDPARRGARRPAAGATGGEAPSGVVAPALGGVLVSHEVARGLACPGLFTERQDGRMALRRGFALEPGAGVVVVEDVITTGGSTREVMDVVRAQGARVLAAGSLVDRSGGRAELGVAYAQPARARGAELRGCGVPAVRPGRQRPSSRARAPGAEAPPRRGLGPLYRVTLAYDGTDFAGFQLQRGARPHRPGRARAGAAAVSRAASAWPSPRRAEPTRASTRSDRSRLSSWRARSSPPCCSARSTACCPRTSG